MIESNFLCLRLFIMRIGKSTSGDVAYRIVFGVAYPTVNTLPTPIIRGFNEFGKCGSKKLFINEITVACETGKITDLLKSLANGRSLKESFNGASIDTAGLSFDVCYTQKHTVTPWFEEQSTGRQLSYTKECCMPDPLKLFEMNGTLPEGAAEALEQLEAKLQNLTKLPFGKEYDHVGNLLLTTTPDRDDYGKCLIKHRFVKEGLKCIKVYVAGQLFKAGDMIAVNVRMESKGKVVSDSIRAQTASASSDMEFVFPYEDALSFCDIKVWRTSSDGSMLIHRASMAFIQQINIRLSVLGQEYAVDSEWLQKIRAELPEKKKGLADKARKVVHSATEHVSIKDGTDGSSADRRSRFRKKPLSNDVFFPKGWDKETATHGRLSLHEWFQKKAQKANKIFIQDPYFEDVALFFIATTGVEAETTILTQTHLKTNADGCNAYVPEDEIASRENLILATIRSNPSLYDSMKLVVKDITGKNNVLHDRYMFFFYDDGHLEGYNLSNSLQGAASRQPLLITEIREPALSKVIEHIKSGYDSHEVSTLYDWSLRHAEKLSTNAEIADAGFFDWLSWFSNKKKALNRDVTAIVDDLFHWNTFARLSTAGYCLAHWHRDTWPIAKEAAKVISKSPERVATLKKFILQGHYEEFPIGYRNNPKHTRSHQDATLLLGMSYAEIVSSRHCHIIEGSGSENFGYGVWGQYYACMTLTHVSEVDTVDVLKQLNRTLRAIRSDKTVHPVYKATDTLLSCILRTFTSGHRDKYIDVLLTDPEEWCRGLGALMMMYKAGDSDISSRMPLFRNDDEKETFCIAALGCKPDVQDKDLLYKELVAIYSNASDESGTIKSVTGFLLETRLPQDIADYIRNVVKPLVENRIIDKQRMTDGMIEGLFKPSICPETANRMQDVLSACLSTLEAPLDGINEQAKELIRHFDKDMLSMIIKTDDAICGCAREPINLRHLLTAILEKYTDKSRRDVETMQKVLLELDSKLKATGLS